MKFAILIYAGVEPIDIATYGVLSMARRVEPTIEIFTVAAQAGEVRLASGLRVIADYGYDECPPADVLIVTGGPGWTEQVQVPATTRFLRRMAEQALVSSVCTGAMLLAAAGLLSGKTATTKRETLDDEEPPLKLLRERYPDIKISEAGIVDEDSVITGGGVTLGIDTTLYVLKRCYSERVANETARILEYARAWKANAEALPWSTPDGTAEHA